MSNTPVENAPLPAHARRPAPVGLRAWVHVAWLVLLPPLVSCMGLGTGSTDCALYSQDYRAALDDEGALSESVPVEAPYPMAVIVSEDALNRLFAAVAEADLPPVTLVEEPLSVPVTITLHPQLPLIQVGGERGCAECLLTELGFGLTVDVAGAEATGTGTGRYQFPLALRPNGLESTTVLARLGDSTLLDIDLQISGVEDRIMNVIEPVIADAATLIVRETVGDTELFDLGSWTFGNGDVRLLGRGPVIEPAFRTVVLGIHTNLVRPLQGAIDVDPALPTGADIGLQIHPELVQRMVQRMLTEGEIPRTYDLAGQSDPAGDQRVTLNFLQAAETVEGSGAAAGSDLLRTNFRLWRTSGGLCGWADLQADLGLSISDARVQLAIENLAITDGAGSGAALMAVDDWYRSAFTDGLIEFSELTINYREVTLPGDKSAEMSAESFRLDVGSGGLSVYLNIDAILDGTD